MATLGRTGTGASQKNIGDNFQITSIGTMSEDGSLDSVHLQIPYNNGNNGGPRLFVYKGSIGSLTLVADCGQVGSSTGVVSASASSEALSNGDALWVGFKHDNTYGIGFRHDTGSSGDSVLFADVDADHDPAVAPPSSISASGTASANLPVPAYITYTASGGSGGTRSLAGAGGLAGLGGLAGRGGGLVGRVRDEWGRKGRIFVLDNLIATPA